MEPRIKALADRSLNGEAIINEGNKESGREQVLLVANANGYPPNAIMAKITAGADQGKWGRWDPNGANGLADARGYLYESRRKSAGTQRATVLVRDCELNGKKCDWNGASGPQIAAAIANLMAIVVGSAYGNVRVRY